MGAEAAVAVESVGQRLAGDVLHDQERHPLNLIDRVDRDDVLVLEGRGGTSQQNGKHSEGITASRRFLIAARPPRKYAWRHGGRDANTERHRSRGPPPRPNCSPSFTMSCASSPRKRWPENNPGRPSRPPPWCTRPTCGLWTPNARNSGTVAGTSSRPPPRPCAASWWTAPGQGVRKARRPVPKTRHRLRRPRHHGRSGPGTSHRRSSRQTCRRRPTRGPAGRASILRRSVDRRLRGGNRHLDGKRVSLVGFRPRLASQRIVRVRRSVRSSHFSFNFLVEPEKISGRIPH